MQHLQCSQQCRLRSSPCCCGLCTEMTQGNGCLCSMCMCSCPCVAAPRQYQAAAKIGSLHHLVQARVQAGIVYDTFRTTGNARHAPADAVSQNERDTCTSAIDSVSSAVSSTIVTQRIVCVGSQDTDLPLSVCLPSDSAADKWGTWLYSLFSFSAALGRIIRDWLIKCGQLTVVAASLPCKASH